MITCNPNLLPRVSAFTEVAEGADGAEAEKGTEAPTVEPNEAPEETPKAEARLQAPWDHGKSWECVGLIMNILW